MFLRGVAVRGMPARGSIQDRIACEMLFRERQRALASHTYLGRIFASGLNLPEKLLQFWTTLLALEIGQENYEPNIIKEKEKALMFLEQAKKDQTKDHTSMFHKLQKLTVHDDKPRPATPEDLERFKRHLRKAALRNSK